MLSLPTLLLLRRILGQQSLAVGAPDFVGAATVVLGALAELDAAIEAATPTPDDAQ